MGESYTGGPARASRVPSVDTRGSFCQLIRRGPEVSTSAGSEGIEGH